MIGECNKYSEISIFNGNEMIKKTGYDSFNKYNYFYWLLISNKRDEAIKAIGDTIKNQISLSNFIFDEKGIKSFDIYREVNILKDVNDSLLIKSSYNTIKVYVDN
jgi:response regulator of citrate/malate metabolism